MYLVKIFKTTCVYQNMFDIINYNVKFTKLKKSTFYNIAHVTSGLEISDLETPGFWPSDFETPDFWPSGL